MERSPVVAGVFGTVRLIWNSPVPTNPANSSVAGSAPILHSGYTGSDPDCEEDPGVSALLGNPNPVPHSTISSVLAAGVEAPGYSVVGPTRLLSPCVAMM